MAKCKTCKTRKGINIYTGLQAQVQQAQNAGTAGREEAVRRLHQHEQGAHRVCPQAPTLHSACVGKRGTRWGGPAHCTPGQHTHEHASKGVYVHRLPQSVVHLWEREALGGMAVITALTRSRNKTFGHVLNNRVQMGRRSFPIMIDSW